MPSLLQILKLQHIQLLLLKEQGICKVKFQERGVPPKVCVCVYLVVLFLLSTSPARSTSIKLSSFKPPAMKLRQVSKEPFK
jgi:hypothetical protein